MKIRQVISRLSIALITFIVGASAVLIWVNYFAEEMWESPVVVPAVENTRVPGAADFGEDYAVYSAVLAQNYQGEVIVIGDYTSRRFADDEIYMYRESSRLTGETIAGYRRANEYNEKLWDFFKVKGSVILLSEKEEKELFPSGEGGWERFYQKYPAAKGIIYFSKVGYNSKHTQALIHYTYQSGRFGYEESFIFLEKKKGVWISGRAENPWIVE